MPVDVTGVTPSQEAADKYFPCTYIGPSWQVDDDGQWLLPKYTLGWEILGWVAQWLTNPDGDPWIFSDEQARLILWLYEVDRDGERVYRKGVIQRAKGHGKDPLAAALCLVELIGPCKFSHWENGHPVAKANTSSWVQLAATTTEQNKNTMLLIPSMLPKRTREQFGLDVQKQIIHVTGTGRRLEAVSSNFAGLEGARPSFALLNETHHWKPSQGGSQLYETLRNNVDKVDGWYLCITNAYQPGQGSVAEEIRLAVNREREGLAMNSGWFFDSVEAHPDAPMTPDWSLFILTRVYGDSWWVKFNNIMKSLIDTSVPVSKLRRMFYNQVVATEDALFSEGEWDAIRVFDFDIRGRKIPRTLGRGDEIVLGFDGGKTDDATALVAMRIADRFVTPIHIWQKPDVETAVPWRINEQEVDSMVHMAFREYKVRAFFADVALWESYIAEWSDLYREQLLIKASPQSAIGYDMRQNRKKITLANEALMQSVFDRKTVHDGDPLLRRHALNAKRHENEYGLTFRKESRESNNKVDGYAAMLLAHMAQVALAESGKKAAPQYTSRLYQF